MYQYDEATGEGLWGGFALRQPASLTVTSDAPVTLEKNYNIPQKYEGTGHNLHHQYLIIYHLLHKFQNTRIIWNN